MITRLQRGGSYPGMYKSAHSFHIEDKYHRHVRAHTHTNRVAYTPLKTSSSQDRRTVNVTAAEAANSHKQGIISLLVPLHMVPGGGHKNQIFLRVQGLFPCVCSRDTLPLAPDNLLLSHCVMLHSFNACVIHAHMHVSVPMWFFLSRPDSASLLTFIDWCVCGVGSRLPSLAVDFANECDCLPQGRSPPPPPLFPPAITTMTSSPTWLTGPGYTTVAVTSDWLRSVFVLHLSSRIPALIFRLFSTCLTGKRNNSKINTRLFLSSLHVLQHQISYLAKLWFFSLVIILNSLRCLTNCIFSHLSPVPPTCSSNPCNLLLSNAGGTNGKHWGGDKAAFYLWASVIMEPEILVSGFTCISFCLMSFHQCT